MNSTINSGAMTAENSHMKDIHVTAHREIRQLVMTETNRDKQFNHEKSKLGHHCSKQKRGTEDGIRPTGYWTESLG